MKNIAETFKFFLKKIKNMRNKKETIDEKGEKMMH